MSSKSHLQINLPVMFVITSTRPTLAFRTVSEGELRPENEANIAKSHKTSRWCTPSSTPVTMEAKLSSIRIMSAACFETSEPVIPMATPKGGGGGRGQRMEKYPNAITQQLVKTRSLYYKWDVAGPQTWLMELLAYYTHNT